MDADSTAPVIQVHGVTLDVNDLELEKEFWSAALGLEIYSEVEGWTGFQIAPGIILDLQRVPEKKTGKNRSHLDVRVRNGDAGIRRLEALGAAIVEHISHGENEWYVMADPEGNEFCAVTRHSHFSVLDAPKVSVNC